MHYGIFAELFAALMHYFIFSPTAKFVKKECTCFSDSESPTINAPETTLTRDSTVPQQMNQINPKWRPRVAGKPGKRFTKSA